jgi:hypothetical protein
MQIFRKILLVWVVLITLNNALPGQFSAPFQRLKSQVDTNPFSFSGYFSSQLLSNATSQSTSRLDPFNYRINSSLNIHSYGIKTQISLHYSDGNRVYRFSKPSVELPSFAFFGISPNYKWATLHVGTRNMNFSRYSLSGHSFQGIGMEMKPGKFQISGMYGRLRRAQIDDFNSLQSLDASFRRLGWGVKVGYESKTAGIHLIYFSAFDDEQNGQINNLPPFLTPAENSIINLQGKKSIGKKISLEFDYALSAYTRDKRETATSNYTGINLLQRMGGLFSPRLSSSFQTALFTKLNIQTNFGGVNLSFERVDPEYRTMGALFFNNDFENITAGSQFSSKNKKWLFNTNLGFQRNNIQKKESNNSNRLIASFQSSLKVNKALTINGGFSNYKTTQKLSTSALPFIETDSLVLALVNQNFNLSFTLGSGHQQKNLLSGMVQFQKASAIENDLVIEEQSNSNYLGQIMYSHTLNSNKSSFFLQLQMNKNQGYFTDFLTLAPTLGWSSHFFDKKLNTQISTSLINIYTGGNKTNQIFQPRLRLSYNPNKNHQVGIQAVMTNQQGSIPTRQFSELTSRIEWKLRL